MQVQTKNLKKLVPGYPYGGVYVLDSKLQNSEPGAHREYLLDDQFSMGSLDRKKVKNPKLQLLCRGSVIFGQLRKIIKNLALNLATGLIKIVFLPS